jgi:hypothetical protein
MSHRQHQRDILATEKREGEKLATFFAKHKGTLSYTADVWSDDSKHEYFGITVE